MIGVDPKLFEFALGKIDDGFIFERFAQEFLSNILGHSFSPAGGIKDRGIDGLEHIFSPDQLERQIYQMSIEKSPERKIEDTLEKLTVNQIDYELLVYVTNQKFANQDRIIDKLFGIYKKPIWVYDLAWFSTRVNSSAATVNLYNSFVSEYLKEFTQPGKSFEIGDLVSDPRLFVFLRQQWEENRLDLALDEILADTLIMYCLEDTDPDKELLKTPEQIKNDISRLIKFEPKLLHSKIDERLNILSHKPRKIHFHSKNSAYCLPYETRLKIQERNFDDISLHELFVKGTEKTLKTHLEKQNVKVLDCVSLIEQAFRYLFYQQGLEFSGFVLKGENIEAIEKNLPDIISRVVEESSVIPGNKNKVKTALLLAVRDIVYKGDEAQKNFLCRLSNTYMMLFLLQCDPKLATYFSALSSHLEVYVCTSIIIPALSEYYLESANRRHWNLLKGAHSAGVSLVIDENILDELVSHFSSIKHIYNTEYKGVEDLYLDELQMLYVDEIMIRSYFYARIAGKVQNFDDFLDSFVNPDLSNAEEALVIWLKEEFGITYRASKTLDIHISKEEESLLLEKLVPLKKNITSKARSDARVILSIYALREKNNELASTGSATARPGSARAVAPPLPW